MLTTLSMWLLYISSYCIAYLFIAFEIIIIGVIDNNTRIYFTVSKNLTFETTGMLASYILPMICCGFNIYLGLVLFMVILLVGIAVIRGGYLHTCCVFLLKRYYIYSDDKGMIVITKTKMERFNLEQRDNPNGIEVRQIAKDIYLACEN